MSIEQLYQNSDATALADAIAAGDIAPAELLDHALQQTAEQNPAINAVTLLQEDTARLHIKRGLPSGPFTGVPFLLKDLGAEAIDYPSHCGSNLLRNTRYRLNASLVQRLLNAGLVIFGRTAAPEGGIGPVTEAAVYGAPTRNPCSLDHTPGGSSGGAGAAVAAGIVPAAHGSDGGGSVRIPASCCGLFGFKATRARLPDGPYAGEGWAGMAIDGFLTRSVRDSVRLLDCTRGADLGAPYHAPAMEESFSQAIQCPPKTLRIAFTDTNFDGDAIHPECAQAVTKIAKLLADTGHHVEPAFPRADHRGMMRAWTQIVACGTALWVKNALKGRPLQENDIEPVAHSAIDYARAISGADYLAAINTVHAYGRQMAEFFNNYDILLSSTLAEPPAAIGRFSHQRDESFLDYRMGENGIFRYSPFTACFNASGQPATSLPARQTDKNLPIGAHLAAAFGNDALLMQLSAQLEARIADTAG